VPTTNTDSSCQPRNEEFHEKLFTQVRLTLFGVVARLYAGLAERRGHRHDAKDNAKKEHNENDKEKEKE
jgi:hypothetical protein